jgi:hypothetical protein
MYWRVVPGLGGRDDGQPEELLEGTREDVVVVGGVGVVGGVAAEAEPDASGTACKTANTLTKAKAESAGSRR